MNLNTNYGAELGPVHTCVGYTRQELLEDDESDSEISIGIEASVTGYLIPAMGYRYPTEADGGFMELSIYSRSDLFNGRMSLEPYIMEGLEIGYASQ